MINLSFRTLVFIASSLSVLMSCSKYEPKDREWVKAANSRIKKYRQAPLTIMVIDSKGRPLPGVTVTIKQLSQSFDFGTLVRGSKLVNPRFSKYQAIVKSNFNLVVPADFQWIKWNDPRSCSTVQDTALKALQWCRANGINVKGHYLAWSPIRNYSQLKSALPKKEYGQPVRYKHALLGYVTDVLTTTNGYVKEWDAVNHLVANRQKAQLKDANNNNLNIGSYLGSDIYKTILDTARQLSPAAKFYVNEDNIFSSGSSSFKSSYYDKILQLQQHSVKIDGVGFMSHFKGNDLPSVSTMLSVLEQYRALHLPLKITEFDVLFGKRDEPYEMNQKEMELQGRFTEDFMRLCYAEPAVKGFIIWGFWQPETWYSSSAMYDKDWQAKPNGKVWQQLVLHEWRTNKILTTDKSGHCGLRAFFGKFSITIINKNGKSVTYLSNVAVNGTRLKLVL